MALEAGSVFVKLGGLFKRDDFDKWDRAVQERRAEARKPVEVNLDAKTTAVERKMAVVKALLDRYRQERATATIDLDKRNFDKKILEAIAQMKLLEKASKDAAGSLAADMERAGVSMDRTAVKAKNAKNEINLLAPVLAGVGRAFTSASRDADGFLARAGAAASGAGRGGTGLGGVASGALGALGGLPLPVKLAPVLAPAGLGLLGGASALVGSLGAGALGAGALGAGALGAGGAGIASIMSVLKPAQDEIKKTTTAWDAYQKAVDRFGAGSKQAVTAQQNLNAVTKEQNPAILAAVKQIDQFGESWTKATKVGQAALVGIMGDAIGQVNKHVGELAKMVDGVAVGLRRDLKPLWDSLFSGHSLDNIHALARGFTDLLGPGIKIVANLLQAFLNIAVAMQPHLMHLADGMLAWSNRVKEATQNHAGLKRVLDGLVSQFMSWMRLTEALGKLLVAFFGAGAKQGQGMVDGLTKILNKWTEWIHSNPDKISKFFSDSIGLTKTLFGTLAPVIKLFVQMTASLMPALETILKAIAPVVTVVVNGFAAMVRWIAELVKHNPELQVLLGAFVGIATVWKTMSFLGSITGVTKLIGLFKSLKVASAEAAAMEEAAAAAGGGAGGAGAASVAGKGLLAGGAASLLRVAAPAAAITALSAFDFYRGTQGTVPGGQLASMLGPTPGSGGIRGGIAGAAKDVLGPYGGNAIKSLFSDNELSSSQKGIKSLQENLKGVGDVSKLSTARLNELVGQARELARMSDITAKQRAGLHDLVQVLNTVRIPRDKWNKEFNDAWVDVNKFYRNSKRDLGSLKDDFDTNMRRIESSVGLHTAAGASLMRTNVNKMVSALLTGMKNGQIGTVAGLKAINEALDKGVRSGAITWQQRWTTMFKSLDDLYKHHKINVATYLKDLNDLIDQMSRKGGKDYLTNMQTAFGKIEDLYRKHKITSKQWSDEVHTILNDGSKKIRDDINTHYREAMDNLKNRLHDGKITHEQFNHDVKVLDEQRNTNTKAAMSSFAGMFVAGYANAHHLSGPELQKLIHETNLALKSLHAAPISELQVDVGGVASAINNATKSITNFPLLFRERGGSLPNLLETGGKVPGREYGLGDQMTLVDPTGRPRAKMAGDEGILTRHQMPLVDRALGFAKAVGASAFGSLRDLWSGVTKPHGYERGGPLGFARGGRLPGFQGGGALSYAQLEGLWNQAGGSPSQAALMAAIAEAESGGNPNAHNASGATGLWQILGNPFPGNAYDPLTNARMAVAKYQSQGLGAWVTYTNGAYRQFMNGNVAPSAAGVSVASIKAPHVSGNSTFASMLNKSFGSVTDAANKYIQAHTPTVSAGGPGGLTAQGPAGVGTYKGVPMADWVIQALQYGAAHGSGDPQPTSGYRPGVDPHTASGKSEHQGSQYPHGAVDFGGPVDRTAYAHKMAVVNATRSFKWPLLAPVFQYNPGAVGGADDGHASGTGHQRGGMLEAIKRFASGGNVWSVLTSQEDSGSGWGWTELSPNGNAARKLGIPQNFSNSHRYPDFASLGQDYTAGSHSGHGLRLNIWSGSGRGTWPMTDYGDGSSYAPVIGLTPNLWHLGGRVNIQRADGQDLHPHPAMIRAGAAKLVSGSAGAPGGGSTQSGPTAAQRAAAKAAATRTADIKLERAAGLGSMIDLRRNPPKSSKRTSLPEPHGHPVVNPTAPWFVALAHRIINQRAAKRKASIVGGFKHIPDVEHLANVTDQPFADWATALENQYSLVSSIAGETDYAQTTALGKSGDTTIALSDPSGFNVGDSITIAGAGDAGASLNTSITGKPTGNVFPIADALAADVHGGTVYDTTGGPHLKLTNSGNPSDLGLVNLTPTLPSVDFMGNKLGFTWPQFPAGTNVYDAELWDKQSEIGVYQGKVGAWRAMIAEIRLAVIERLARRKRIDTIMHQDFGKYKEIQQRRAKIQQDLRDLQVGDAKRRIEVANSTGAKNARVQDARGSISSSEARIRILRANISEEKKSKHPDQGLISKWEGQIAHEQGSIAGERQFIAKEQASVPHGTTAAAIENLAKIRLRQEYSDLGTSEVPIKDELKLIGGSSTAMGTGGFIGKINSDLNLLQGEYKDANGKGGYVAQFTQDISNVLTQTIPQLQLDIRGIASAKQQAVVAGAIAGGTGSGSSGGGSSATSAADIAAAALADLTAYQTDLSTLFATFGSNFVGAGVGMDPSLTGQAAGFQHYGAVGGGGPLVHPAAFQGGGPITNHYSFTNNYGAGPPDPHTYSAQQRYNLQALVG